MKNYLKLCHIKPGEEAEIAGLVAEGSIRRRLIDIGLVEGTKISCLFKSPFSDPTAYQIRGAVIALRREDSENIIVKR